MTRILPTDLDRSAFIAAARSLDGMKFRPQARGLRGVDCVGLCVFALAQMGIQCEDMQGYSNEPDGKTLRANLEKHLGAPVTQWRAGDIVLMRWYETKRKCWDNHVGILTDYPLGGFALLHADGTSGVRRVVEHRLGSPWDRRISAVYSLTGAA
jgi:cell wall-associated NlpC family hydrolase